MEVFFMYLILCFLWFMGRIVLVSKIMSCRVICMPEIISLAQLNTSCCNWHGPILSPAMLCLVSRATYQTLQNRQNVRHLLLLVVSKLAQTQACRQTNSLVSYSISISYAMGNNNKLSKHKVSISDKGKLHNKVNIHSNI